MPTPTHPLWKGDPAILNAAKNAPALKQGASGSGVQRLRDALKEVGAPDSTERPDQFGPVTSARVASFQGGYGLTADGIAGAATINKLDELLLNPAKRKPWPQAEFSGREEFLQKVAAACTPHARKAGYPVSAMLACAAVESGWGSGPIYKETKNLFSLQKWPWVKFPETSLTLWRKTVIQTKPVKFAKAPFNTATDLADAGRQWCEWIQYYGTRNGPPGSPDKAHPQAADNTWATGRRDQLVKMAGDPVLFAKHLYLVSFGEGALASQLYARVLQENQLTRFD